MIVSHIVAAANNGVIGFEGKMPWHLSEDLKRFKKITMGSCIIMGRKTYESIGRPLPGRFNIVITRQKDFSADGAYLVTSIEEALHKSAEVSEQWGNEVFIIGGGEIYRQSIGLVSRIYLTLIDEALEGDTDYPLGEIRAFKESKREDFSGSPGFSFITLDRET